MKLIVGAAVALLLSASAFAQGTVHFGNTPTTLISSNFNGQMGVIQGFNTFQFALYTGPLGQSAETMSLAAVAANPTIVNGRFEGGNVALGIPGQTVSFQVRAWSTLFGQNASSHPLYFGQSTVGFVSVFPSSGPVELFGTNPGQVGGFVISGVPEPSGYALAMGAAWLAVLCRGCHFRKEG